MDVSRVMRGKIELRRERVELSTIIARAIETVQPLIEVQAHKLQLSIPAESLPLNADPIRLTQVFGNLLTNAAKYTDPNGNVWLSAERQGEDVVVEVRDNGIGIAPDMLPHIFGLFVQADDGATKARGGLGIGLTLVKSLVEMHGGSVDVHSEGLKKGSVFTVRLPLTCESQQAGGEDVREIPSPNPNDCHPLMVVDDNIDAATSFAMLLRAHGHDVHVAHGGVSALAELAVFRPEMIFLDIGMPEMDGYEVAKRIRESEEFKNIILVALTGWGQPEDRRRSKAAGFDYHLVKPPEPKEIMNLLKQLNHR
jgi:CheY-like chemotaxis protein/two-component sensor histidine kinase